MPTITSWLYWTCRQCGKTQIRGDNKTCPACGHQQDHDERLAMEATVTNSPRSEDQITDQATLDRVEGPGKADWWCNNCDRSVEFNATTCPLCHAPKDATAEDLGSLNTHVGVRENREMDGTDRTVLVERFGPMEGREILAGRGNTDTTGREDARRTLEEEDSDFDRPPIVDWMITNRIIIGAILLGIGLISLLIWGFMSHEVDGRVFKLTWEHEETIQRFTPVVESDWETDIHPSQSVMPVNGSGERAGAQIIRCEQKFHHNDHYICGTTPVQHSRSVQSGESCSTTPTTCSSNGNGTQTCSGGDRVCTPTYTTELYTEMENQYCDRPVYMSHCSYNTYQWQSRGSKVVTGQGYEVFWPNLSTGPLDRCLKRSTYKVGFEWKEHDERHEETQVVSWPEYKSWHVDDKVVVSISNFGKAKIVPRKEISQKN